ncbi:hypothetical protein EU528_10615 [Candidatus Thorarchaeota archaeon]|nr:MAG: hypothetical protein EU528_10615 [Candidatus Thorarchaeota archaeon]
MTEDDEARISTPEGPTKTSDRIIELNSWQFSFLTAVAITLVSITYVQTVMTNWGIYGFSFDDSWIHVQYARTIFEGNAWQYATGIPSTGSSGPLWSVVLAPVFLFGYDHDVIVTSVLTIAGLLYIVNVFLVGEIVKQHTEIWEYGVIAQIVFVLVPRNAGLMLSGMETPLGMMLILLALLILPRPEWKYDMILGVVAGLAYLCRPEFVLIAAILLPVRALTVLYRSKIKSKRIFTILLMFVAAVLVVTPWILHCLNTTGNPLPDSYYSKTRFGISQEGIDLWDYYWFRVWLPFEPYLILSFIGGLVILARKHRPYELLLIGSLYTLYRLTMPGMSLLFAARYLVPLFNIMGIAFVCGIALIVEKVAMVPHERIRLDTNERKILTVLITLCLFLPSIASSIMYTDIHANQAKNIEEMQVTLSLWIRENLPDNEYIATYDVGAIGYFAKGPVLDLYGLVTPVLLYNYNNSISQATFLKSVNCRYVLYYVQWIRYVEYGVNLEGGNIIELFRVHLDDNIVCGTDDMAVYEIDWNV